MQIVRASEKHIPGMLHLLQQVGEVHHQGRPDIFRAGAQKYDVPMLQALLQDADSPIFIAEDDDRVLGYGFCKLKRHAGDPIFTDTLELYIDDLCVEESCRGQHIGSAVYQHICCFAREIGCYNITLNVWSFNESALKFYEKCGMKPQRIFMETILEK